MTPKKEQRKKFFLTVDEWLDEKKKTDGAEGLWRIHDKLYDFTLWSRIHPGGKFWLDISRGTDITQAFESHHFSNKAESLLSTYYRREAAAPKSLPFSFCPDGFYRAFKRKVQQKELPLDYEVSYTVQLLVDVLAATVFLTGLLGVQNGNIWIVASGLSLGVLSILCHSFFHMKHNWRAYYFNLSLMSLREWKVRHVLSHHQYQSTDEDLEISLWCPFSGGFLAKIANTLFFFVASHAQFLQRCLDVFLSKKLGFHPEEMVSLSFPLFLVFFSKVPLWQVFLKWNMIVLIGSFVFCFFSSSFYRSKVPTKDDNNTTRKQDFGNVLLSLIPTHPNEKMSIISFFEAFRGNILHYLCPKINHRSLIELIPAFEDTMEEFGILYEKDDEEFLKGVENAIPEGHVFFS